MICISIRNDESSLGKESSTRHRDSYTMGGDSSLRSIKGGKQQQLREVELRTNIAKRERSKFKGYGNKHMDQI